MIGERFREVIKSGGLHQAELARRTGLTTATISRVTTGEREASYKTIDRILDALEMEVVFRPRRGAKKGE
jgi:transcriptional regulator with XRE-family HTH domain